MRRFAAAALLAAALAACAMEQVAGGVDDGVAAVDKTYYRIPAPVQFAGPARGIREVTVYVRASGAGGTLRVCGAYVADVNDFQEQSLVDTFSQERGGLLVGAGEEAVILPLKFMRFNRAQDRSPYQAGCYRTAVGWKPSFSGPPQLLSYRSPRGAGDNSRSFFPTDPLGR
jgi:hypothetical protein